MTVPPLDKTGKHFEQWWNLSGDWVEPPNLRRGGESGVQRLTTPKGELAYSKKQTHHIYRSLRYPLGRATILREYEAFKALTALNIPVPTLLYCGIHQDGRALLITKALEGFTDLDHWLAHEKPTHSAPITQQLLEKIAQATASMHLNRYQHGCLYGKHIFVNVSQDSQSPTIDIALLDLEKVRRRSNAKKAALHDMPKLKRHSLLTAPEWSYLISCYEKTFGKALHALH